MVIISEAVSNAKALLFEKEATFISPPTSCDCEPVSETQKAASISACFTVISFS